MRVLLTYQIHPSFILGHGFMIKMGTLSQTARCSFFFFDFLLKIMGLQIPLKSILIDGNCRVEDRGLKTHHGQVSFLFPLQNILGNAKVCMYGRALY